MDDVNSGHQGVLIWYLTEYTKVCQLQCLGTVTECLAFLFATSNWALSYHIVNLKHFLMFCQKL